MQSMVEDFKGHKRKQMKTGGSLHGKCEPHKLGCGAMVKCLLFAVVILSVLNPAVLPNSVFQSRWTTNQPVIIEEKPNSDVSNSGHAKLSLRLIAKTRPQNEGDTTSTVTNVSTPPNREETIEQIEREPIKRIDIRMSAFNSNSKQEQELESLVEKKQPTGPDTPVQSSETIQSQETTSYVSFNELEKTEENSSMIESGEKHSTPNKIMEESSPTKADRLVRTKSSFVGQNDYCPEVQSNKSFGSVSSKILITKILHYNNYIHFKLTELRVNNSKLIYNSRNSRYNISFIEGDIRIVPSAPNASTIFVVSSTPLDPNTRTWKIKPFPRKWESHTMEAITEMTIQQLTDVNQARSCDVTHDLPAVVFSTRKFTENLFHAYTDVLYPLFLATRRYHGEVRLVVEDYVSKYIEKYQVYLTRLSHYPIINLDNETRVHCFSSVQVGLENPGPLGYKFQNPQNDQVMLQFRHFISESLSLERSEVKRTKKPRLLMLLRKNTRSIINENDVINLTKEVGFEVVTADVETTKDFPRIAHIVNSCDVLMGIHGAGLANMLYLPTNGTVLQITPYGYLKWVGRYDYGDPPRGFGLRYVEYEITLDESTLTEKYPRDHPVITDPKSIHRKGWQMVYEVYLWDQNVKLDLNRFRGTLEEAFQLYQ